MSTQNNQAKTCHSPSKNTKSIILPSIIAIIMIIAIAFIVSLFKSCGTDNGSEKNEEYKNYDLEKIEKDLFAQGYTKMEPIHVTKEYPDSPSIRYDDYKEFYFVTWSKIKLKNIDGDEFNIGPDIDDHVDFGGNKRNKKLWPKVRGAGAESGTLYWYLRVKK